MPLQSLLFGKLTLNDIPYHDPIIMSGGALMGIMVLSILFLITYYKKWHYLWHEWITSVDHKKIGTMYIILALVMLIRGFTDAIMMRLQQALALLPSKGYLPPAHFNQVFTAHGDIMIFFVAMPLIFGLLNFAIPLQIGARDVAYPFLNSLSFWMTVTGALLINVSLVIGDYAATGWLAYPPLSGIKYSPGVGVDYFIWALQIAGVGSLLSGINFIVTILKMRCPGMTLMKMPLFSWSALCSMALVVGAFPALAATLEMLFADRFFGMHFFTAGHGGNAMLYVNLIWAWGHPEVYILILPAFGVFSEVIATFSRKKLFGYVSMVYATIAITFLSFVVWLHHFFTMGAGPTVNAFFGIATMIIAIPTGVKIFNWLFTMYRGRITFSVPMLWSIGFISTFAVGGMTGVLLSLPPVDFQLHNSVFLVAHFHNTIIGGVVFGSFAGLTYWFPKIFGFYLDEKWGKRAFYFWIIGFYIAFMPLYALGLMGMTRRLSYYANANWHPFLIIAAVGVASIGLGIVSQFIQFIVSFKNKEKYRVTSSDPWENGRTLEWSIPCPAPHYNFAVIPTVNERDAYWAIKEKNLPNPNQFLLENAAHIPMPANTAAGFWVAVFSGLFGFAMVWHIAWMITVGLLGIFITLIVKSFQK
ncbi:MAG: cytochrome o ubiquinol oxidase subunit I [Gammaproteobacteria bacterium CG_4_10_14_0_8_um_filter_38_16]|nr:MAG: cytochrome o ubiquinol oxidase subunit I [Gammaproteobacteria bacterium CG_4_10_14_0_8_um_filter_38_16]PJA04303.1 MAG: cytochrome o ubiquinol oxidase subunit I [Gammaproteobacteria bacterium CG_4_10_14_0_2_um_filter_38_22]PJB10057.1 MAG: cytochrome o ubiquinol oxidase subunit I [Gammaproteobacteria bacterium CG_4_9_14_3_um_filter_38_9]